MAITVGRLKALLGMEELLSISKAGKWRSVEIMWSSTSAFAFPTAAKSAASLCGPASGGCAVRPSCTAMLMEVDMTSVLPN